MYDLAWNRFYIHILIYLFIYLLIQLLSKQELFLKRLHVIEGKGLFASIQGGEVCCAEKVISVRKE